MSLVTPQPVPDIQPIHWATVFAGLGLGMSAIFTIISLSASTREAKRRVFTPANFWLIMSGVIHMDMYAAADYRYGDYNGLLESGTAAMEAITAVFVGPLCFLVAYASVHDYAWYHPSQIVLCTMQVYGLVWFTLQPIFSHEGITGHFSSDPVLFWAVAVGCNAPWAIFPTILLFYSFHEVCKKMKNDNSSQSKRK